MSSNREVSTGGGIGFFGALTVAFAVLKVLGELNWSWWWVFSPIWIPWGIILICLLVFGVGTLCLIKIDSVKK